MSKISTLPDDWQRQMSREMLKDAGIRKRMMELIVKDWQTTHNMRAGMVKWLNWWEEARKNPRKKR